MSISPDKGNLKKALKELGLEVEDIYVDFIASQLMTITGLIDTLQTLAPWMTKEKGTIAAAFLIARQFNEDVPVPELEPSSNPVDTSENIDNVDAKIDAHLDSFIRSPYTLTNEAIPISTFCSQHNEALKPLPPVCRHFMQGDCRRKDCAFSHNLSQIPCKFYASTGDLKKVCSAGDDCPFLHEVRPGSGVDIRSIDNAESQTYSTAAAMSEEDIEFLFSGERLDEIGPLDLDDEESFPSLSGPTSYAHVRRKSSKKPSTSSSVSIASKLAFQVLSDAFPTAPSEFLKRCFEEGKGVTAAARLVIQQTGLEPVKSALTGRNLLIQPTNSSSQIVGGSRSCKGGGREESTAKIIASSLFHASTGEDMSALYTMHRREAEAMARERNSLFDKAARAFLNGNGASAAALSKEGRKLDEKMKELHTQAASAIFSSRNSSKAGGGVFTVNSIHGPVAVSAVDLHGLHSNEAIRASEDAVSVSSGIQWIALLAGAGSHSNNLGGGGSVYESILDHFNSGRCASVMETYGVNGSVIVLHLLK